MPADIKDEDCVLRRVPNGPPQFVFDKNINKWRLSSAWFSDEATNDMEVSVTLEKDLLESGGEHIDAVHLENPKHRGFGLARCAVNILRNNFSTPQEIRRDPTEEDPFHALVVGKKSKREKSKTAKAIEIIIEPDTHPR